MRTLRFGKSIAKYGIRRPGSPPVHTLAPRDREQLAPCIAHTHARTHAHARAHTHTMRATRRDDPPPTGWRRKGTASRRRSPLEKARDDELRIAFARGLKRDILRANQGSHVDDVDDAVSPHDLVRRFVEFLVDNEAYFLRACWNNPHLCRTYRATGALLVRWCRSTSGCAAHARVLEDEALGWVLCPHKSTMDLEKNEWVDYGAIRDEMMASMARMRKWLKQHRCAKPPRSVPVLQPSPHPISAGA